MALTMKALTVTRFQKQGLDHIQLQDVPVPQPNSTQVMVRIKAAAFNPADFHIASGEMAMMSPVKPPLLLGVDGAGVIEAVGAAVSDFKVGDEVCFYTGLVWSGTMAEYTVVDAASCAHKPAQWSFAQAAASSLALLCADLALERGGVAMGRRILIHGGGGSVGAAAIFLASQRGAIVETTGSNRDAAFVNQLGAQVFHDYLEIPLSRLPQGHYDMVLDSMGERMFLDSVSLLKWGGTLVSLKVMTGLDDMLKMGMQPPWFFKFLLPLIMGKYTRAAKKSGIRVVGVATFPNGARLALLTELAATHGFAPRIDSSYGLAAANNALRHFAQGKPCGKVIVEI